MGARRDSYRSFVDSLGVTSLCLVVAEGWVAVSIEAGPAYRALLEWQNADAYKRLLEREAAQGMSPPNVPIGDITGTASGDIEIGVLRCEECLDRPREAGRKLCAGCRKKRQRTRGVR